MCAHACSLICLILVKFHYIHNNYYIVIMMGANNIFDFSVPNCVTIFFLFYSYFLFFLFCTDMFGALKPGFRSLATLKLVVNVVGEL